MILIVYVLALLALWLQVPPLAAQPQAQAFAALLGVITAWHAGWGGLHLARAVLYRRHLFARLRRQVDQSRGRRVRPSTRTSRSRAPAARPRQPPVSSSALGEGIRFGGPVTIVANIVEAADQRLIKHISTSCRRQRTFGWS